MKEVTYEDWQKNPTPRMMWVWNSNVEDKVQAKVISVVKADACIYPVLSIMKDDIGYDTFQHCAEFGYNKENERLTKAKNLLTRFVMASVYFNGKETDLVEEAEQFLREVEE